jgi:hypothetical protein
VAVPLPISGISPARLEALLESIMLERHVPSEIDSEAIEAVLTALHADELTRVKTVRPNRARSAKVAVSTLASLASVSGGVTAAGVVAVQTESLGIRILDEGSAVALAADAAPDVSLADPGVAPPAHGLDPPTPEQIADGTVGAS